MRLKNLENFNDIVIQIHDNPDADAVGSGYAIYSYLVSKGKQVRFVYSGRNVITKGNMCLLLSMLDIPLEYVTELAPPQLLITVDCQYGEGNVTKFEAENIAMIDHHSTGRVSDDMCEICDHLVSCATVCYSLLSREGYDVNDNPGVATALFYGLYMDSNQLGEINHPLDRDMIDFLKYNRPAVNKLKFANFTLDELETAAVAITNRMYMEEKQTAFFRSAPCDPNILGVVGDFVIQADCIELCVIYNDCGNGYKLSIRSCSADALANEFSVFLTEGVGNGGGHTNKAGGFILKSKLEAAYPGMTIEEYFTSRTEEFFSGYDVVNCADVDLDMSEFRKYRKLSGVFGYIPSTDIFPSGAECKIRTLEGDVHITAGENMYILIGMLGEAYPIEKEKFEKRYDITDLPFEKEFEYFPTVINVKENRQIGLMPYAKQCISHGGSVIYGKTLTKLTKVFGRWEYEKYMAGNKGDMLVCPENDNKDFYIISKAVFELTYEEI